MEPYTINRDKSYQICRNDCLETQDPNSWDNVEVQIGSTPEGTTVHQVAIDEHNRGAFVTHASKDEYKDFKATLEEWQKRAGCYIGSSKDDGGGQPYSCRRRKLVYI